MDETEIKIKKDEEYVCKTTRQIYSAKLWN